MFRNLHHEKVLQPPFPKNSSENNSIWRFHQQTESQWRNNMRRKNPPGLDRVELTNHLVYQYTVPEGNLNEILQKDLKALQIFSKVKSTSQMNSSLQTL